MFEACHHNNTQATWNEYCITCGVRHVAFGLYWRSFRMGDLGVRTVKNYCAFCGEKMLGDKAFPLGTSSALTCHADPLFFNEHVPSDPLALLSQLAKAKLYRLGWRQNCAG
jgi:hypothetical protein